MLQKLPEKIVVGLGAKQSADVDAGRNVSVQITMKQTSDHCFEPNAFPGAAS
jgi:hypothetical protein